MAEKATLSGDLQRSAQRALGRWAVSPNGRREMRRLRDLAGAVVPIVALHADQPQEAMDRGWWATEVHALVVYRPEPDGSETMIAGLARKRVHVGPTPPPTHDPTGRPYAPEDIVTLPPSSALTVGDLMDAMFAEAPDDASAFTADRGLALLA